MVARLITASGRIVADEVAVAGGPARRARGLIGRPEPPQGSALVLPAAKQIHTFGMRYPIDVIFCRSSGEVAHVVRQMKPWRITRPVSSSRWVVEMRSGGADGIVRGDRLCLVQNPSSASRR